MVEVLKLRLLLGLNKAPSLSSVPFISISIKVFSIESVGICIE